MSSPYTLITGGHGLLGTHLRKYFPNIWCPTHEELDIKHHISLSKSSMAPGLVIHCAALKTTVCDDNPLEAMEVNIVGTANVTRLCHECDAKMIYISTDYVFRGTHGLYAPEDDVYPTNYYAETKLAGEYVVKSLPKDKYLIIRLSFFPDIYPYETAYIDQWTSRLPVSTAAKAIVDIMDECGVRHIRGIQQTVYEYALSTAGGKEIKPAEMPTNPDGYKRPRDTSLI